MVGIIERDRETETDLSTKLPMSKSFDIVDWPQQDYFDPQAVKGYYDLLVPLLSMFFFLQKLPHLL